MLGKLVAGLLNILIILAASVGLLFLCTLLGGISFGQVANLFAVTAASGVAGGALGLLVALALQVGTCHSSGGLLTLICNRPRARMRLWKNSNSSR